MQGGGAHRREGDIFELNTFSCISFYWPKDQESKVLERYAYSENKGWQRTLVKWNGKIDFFKWKETPFLSSSPIEVCIVCFMFDYRWLLWLSWWLSRMTSWASFPYPLLYPNSSWRLWSWTRWEVNLNTRVDRGRCTCGDRPKYQLLI